MCKRLLQPLLVQHNPCPDLDSSGRVVIYCRRRPFPTHSRVWPHHAADPWQGWTYHAQPSHSHCTSDPSATKLARPFIMASVLLLPYFLLTLFDAYCWCGKYQLRRNTERYFSFRLWFPLFPSDSDRCTRHSFGFCSKCTARQQRGERRAVTLSSLHTLKARQI